MKKKKRTLSQKITQNLQWRSPFSWLSVVSLVVCVLITLFFLLLLKTSATQYNEEMATYGASSVSSVYLFFYEILAAASVLLAVLLSLPLILSRSAYRRMLKKLGPETKEETRAVADFLMRTIEKGKTGFRCLMVRSVPRFADEHTLDFLVGLLKSKNPPVQVAAIKALAEMGDYRALGPLRAMLDGKDARVSKAAGLAVDALADRSGTEPVGEAAAVDEAGKPDGSQYTTLPYPSFTAAMKALEEHGDPQAITLKKAQYNDYLDLTLAFPDGYSAIYGGFSTAGKHGDARVNLLVKLLGAEGIDDAQSKLEGLDVPAKLR